MIAGPEDAIRSGMTAIDIVDPKLNVEKAYDTWAEAGLNPIAGATPEATF